MRVLMHDMCGGKMHNAQWEETVIAFSCLH